MGAAIGVDGIQDDLLVAAFYAFTPLAEAEQQELARGIAARSPWQAPLRAAVRGLVVLLAAACVQKAVEISSA